MIDQLKEIEKGTFFAFNNEEVISLAETDEAEVSSVKLYSTDENELVVIELDETYLVAHDFDTDPRYFFYQILDSGAIEDLENDGYYFLNEEQDFRNKIVCRDDSRGHIYKHSEVGIVYDMEDHEEETISICEYISNSHELSHILVIKNDEEDNLLILQGIEINEEDFEID